MHFEIRDFFSEIREFNIKNNAEISKVLPFKSKNLRIRSLNDLEIDIIDNIKTFKVCCICYIELFIEKYLRYLNVQQFRHALLFILQLTCLLALVLISDFQIKSISLTINKTLHILLYSTKKLICM